MTVLLLVVSSTGPCQWAAYIYTSNQVSQLGQLPKITAARARHCRGGTLRAYVSAPKPTPVSYPAQPLPELEATGQVRSMTTRIFCRSGWEYSARCSYSDTTARHACTPIEFQWGSGGHARAGAGAPRLSGSIAPPNGMPAVAQEREASCSPRRDKIGTAQGGCGVAVEGRRTRDGNQLLGSSRGSSKPSAFSFRSSLAAAV